MPAGLHNLQSLKLPAPNLRVPARRDEGPLPAPFERGLSGRTDSRGDSGAPTLEGLHQPDAYYDGPPAVSPSDSDLTGPQWQQHLQRQQQGGGKQQHRGATTEHGGQRRDSATSAAASAAATAFLAAVPCSQAHRMTQPVASGAAAAATAAWTLPQPHQAAVSNPVGSSQASSAELHQQDSGDNIQESKRSSVVSIDHPIYTHAADSEPSSTSWSTQHPQPNKPSQPTSVSRYFCFACCVHFSLLHATVPQY